MGLFDGIGNAEIYERGKYMPPGFRGVVEIKKTIGKVTRASGVAFIVEVKVITVDRPGDKVLAEDKVTWVEHDLGPVRVGEKRTWYQSMNDKDIAFGAIMAWAAACACLEAGQKEEIEKEIAPTLEDDLEHATNNPADNDYIEGLVYLQTEYHKTQKGKDFTRYDWSPYDPDEGEPRDAVDEVGS